MIKRNTIVTIRGDEFLLNGAVTYTAESGFPKAAPWIRGKLLMLKSANCIFDDARYPDFGSDSSPYFGDVSWDYPDGRWDPDRNTREFVGALPAYRKHGLLMMNANLMGNQPAGRAASHPWVNSAFTPRGDLKPAYLSRLRRVMDAADELGMVMLVGLFYPRMDANVMVQNSIKKDDALIRKCIVNAVQFLVESGHRNIMVEIGNESNHPLYNHWMLRGERVFEAIQIAREACAGIFPVSTSVFEIDHLTDKALDSMDFVLLHTPVGDPKRNGEQMKAAVRRAGKSKPVMNKEDTSIFCMAAALESGGGFALYFQGLNDYREGLQCIPIDWRINTVGKWNYFSQVARLSGSPAPERPLDNPEAPTTVLKGFSDGDVLTEGNIGAFHVEPVLPHHFPSTMPMFLQRVEYLIDGIPVKYGGKGLRYPETPFEPRDFALNGEDLIHGPLGFDLRKLPRGEHTLLAIPYYLEESEPEPHGWGCCDTTGTIAEVRFLFR